MKSSHKEHTALMQPISSPMLTRSRDTAITHNNKNTTPTSVEGTGRSQMPVLYLPDMLDTSETPEPKVLQAIR